MLSLPSFILSLTLSLLNVDLNLWPISIYDFPFLWRTKFLQGGLWQCILQFLSEEVFISSSLMKNNFFGYTAIGGWLIHSPLQMYYFILLLVVSDKTDVTFYFVPLWVRWFPLGAFLKDLSLVFCSLNMMCLGVPLAISWLVVLWNSWICLLESAIILGKFSAIVTSDVSSVHFFVSSSHVSIMRILHLL